MSIFWNNQLDWLLRCGDSALGRTGTFGAVVARAERGGSPGECRDPHTDEQLQDVRYTRRLWARWVQLAPELQGILAVHYERRPPRQQVGGNAHAWPRGAERLGDCAGVALYGARQQGGLAELLEALVGKQADVVVEQARLRAERLVVTAHAAWDELGIQEIDAWVA